MLSVAVLVTSVFAIVSSAKSNFYEQHRGANDQTTLLLLNAAEVDQLFSFPGKRVRLIGNLIPCICDNKELLDALRTHQDQIDNYESMTCVGGDHDGEAISRLDLTNLCAIIKFPVMLGITTAVLTAICVFIIIMFVFGVWRTTRNTVRENARVIVLGDAHEQKNLNPGLREFLQVNTYVQWDDPMFWNKLDLLQRTTQSVA